MKATDHQLTLHYRQADRRQENACVVKASETAYAVKASWRIGRVGDMAC